MSDLRKFCALLLINFVLTFAVFAQGDGLPQFKKGESYKSVRSKMLKAGWKPYRAPDSDECAAGDKRCENRPEMHVCAGTGLGNCEFLWRRNKKNVAIFTIGEEDNKYSGHKFQ